MGRGTLYALKKCKNALNGHEYSVIVTPGVLTASSIKVKGAPIRF